MRPPGQVQIWASYLRIWEAKGLTKINEDEACQAIQKYKQFLALCITSTNTQGEAMADPVSGVGLSAVGL